MKRPFAFVLMPFASEFDDIYELGIKAAAAEADVEAQRLDDQLFDRSMLEQIYAEIDRADIIVADMSCRTPNVFYEVGYADAKKKLIIFLTRDEDDIPFDLKHRPHIIYGASIGKLKAELTERLNWATQEVQRRRVEPMKVKFTATDGDIVRDEFTDTAQATFHIELHNISDAPITNVHSIYLFTGKGPWKFSYEGKDCKSTPAPDTTGRTRHILVPEFSAVPAHDWRPIDVVARRLIYAEWEDEGPRRDTYVAKGNLGIEVHTEKFVVSHRELVDLTCTWDDIPF